MKLGLYEYNILPIAEQANLLWEHGTYLQNLDGLGKRYVLYQLWDFFVELHYDADYNQIEKLRTFKSNRALEPYLNDINLADLLR
ncbi:hypothetical protein GCM10023189_37690 [Nibrella saemangeumensis]|uniref:Uncharacterized protein n=1 Tax=Nibrella saemangeumensis TaxID=1084526 RepID=A0ABP8N5V1_9BACT